MQTQKYLKEPNGIWIWDSRKPINKILSSQNGDNHCIKLKTQKVMTLFYKNIKISFTSKWVSVEINHSLVLLRRNQNPTFTLGHKTGVTP